MPPLLGLHPQQQHQHLQQQQSQQQRTTRILIALVSLVCIALIGFACADFERLNDGFQSTKQWSVDAYSKWLDANYVSTTDSIPLEVTVNPVDVVVIDENEKEEASTGLDVINVDLKENEQDEQVPPMPPARMLPICRRTLLYKMAGRHGFGSEYSILLKLAVLAKAFDYTMFVDDRYWNYGSLEAYFDIEQPGCRLPPAATNRRAIPFPISDHDEAYNVKSWTKLRHVHWRRDLYGLDRLLVRMLVDNKALAQLRTSFDRPLSAADTLPPTFARVHSALSTAASEWWKLSPPMQARIAPIQRMVDDYRQDSQVQQSPVIGVHVRRGDKFLELDRINQEVVDSISRRFARHSKRGFSQSNKMVAKEVEPYVTAAIRAVNALNGLGEIGDTSSWKTKPVLLLMSDEPDIKASFALDPRSSMFRLASTDISTAPDEPFAARGGFHETGFNRLPLAQRVELGSRFVCDLTFIARHTDAIVMSGSSNVGRLLTILAGPRVIEQSSIYSTDIRWHPTSRYL